MYHQTDKVRKDGEEETLKLVNEPEMYENTEEELTPDTESDIGEESGKDEYCAFVLTLSDLTESPMTEKNVYTVEEKSLHIS